MTSLAEGRFERRHQRLWRRLGRRRGTEDVANKTDGTRKRGSRGCLGLDLRLAARFTLGVAQLEFEPPSM